MSTMALGSGQITVRYFAASRAAAGCDSELLIVGAETTLAQVVDVLGRQNPDLARVLCRCSFLCDGITVRNRAQPLGFGSTIDVLPPFAGG